MEYGLKVTSHAFEKPSAASHDNITFAGGWAVYIYTVCGIWQPWQVCITYFSAADRRQQMTEETEKIFYKSAGC